VPNLRPVCYYVTTAYSEAIPSDERIRDASLKRTEM
jgi:hypothetical protein